MKSIVFWVGLLSLALLCQFPAFPQTYGEITGTVTDPSGAVVVNANVIITALATNQVRRFQTSQAGTYTASFLLPGAYSVQVEMTGFKTATRRDVQVQVGTVTRADFSLEVGEVTQSVEVTGTGMLLATETTDVGQVIDNRRVTELPLNGRNYMNLISLSTNVTAEMGAGGAGTQGGERAQQSFSVSGGRQEFNYYTLDGITNTDVNYNTFIVRPSVDAMQEFKVQTGVYPAEFGRATAQINVATKAGTNDYHAVMFEFLRNDKLDAREWLKSGRKNPFRRNQFGFTFSGRLIRDKLFFMSNFESLHDVKTLEQRANAATTKMRAGDFSGQSRIIFDPATRAFTIDSTGNKKAVSAIPYPGNRIPDAQINPISKKLLEFLPEPTVPGDNIVSNYKRDAKRPQSWEQFNQRLDWNESERSTWFGRFSWSDEYLGNVAAFETMAGKVLTKLYQGMIANTRTFSPTMVNETRFGYTQFQNDNTTYFSGKRDVSSELGIVGLRAPTRAEWGAPAIGLADGLNGFGEPASGPYISRNHTFQFINNLSWVRGRHSMKFGGEVRRDRFNQFGNLKPRGEFLFQQLATVDPANRTTTGHSFADYLLGWTQEAARALDPVIAMLRSTSASFFVDDSWRISRKLTMNIGIRYEYAPPWYDKYRALTNVQIFDVGVGPGGLLPGTRVPIFTRPGKGDFYEGVHFRFHDGIPVQVGDDKMGRRLVATDFNDFAPRIGFAYSPTPKWAFRTGLGVFYTQDTGNPRFDMARNLGGRGLFNSSREEPNSNISDPWRFQRSNYICTGWSGECLGPPQVLGNIYGRRTPYMFQWLFNIQRQLSENVAIELGYQGNSGHKLERLRTYNQAIQKTGPNDTRSIEQRQPWPAYNRIQEVDNVVNSTYHAFNTRLQQRFSHSLTYNFGFTWSKAIDGGSGIRTNSGDRLYPLDSYDLRREKGLSQFHQGRRMVSSIIYELPVGSGKQFLSQTPVVKDVLGGWQIGTILTFTDGSPKNVGSIGDTHSVGSLGNYPDATGLPLIPENRSMFNFWNRSAFDATNPDLTWRAGNSGRNTLTSPGLRNWDFSLIKNTRIREGHRLEFRFEAFNFSNHPNWNTPATDVRSASTFGRVTSARTMRELQFGLKYSF